MQTPLEQLLRRSTADLKAIDIPFALVGGLAYGMRAETRFTRDIDFTIAVASEAEAETVTSQMIQRGYFPQMEIANRHTGALATFRMRHSKPIPGVELDESPFIDLLFSHCGIESETIASATPTNPYPGLTVPTAQRPHLIAMKVLAESDRRLQDRIDLQNLIAFASKQELDNVPALLDLIIQRGFAFEKDLEAVFEKFLAEHRDAQD